jgi:metal-dependent HD superfamily phosphatase/phosphodiesterase
MTDGESTPTHDPYEDVAPEIPSEPNRTVESRFTDRVQMAVPSRHSPKLAHLMDLVNEDDDLYALWVASNVTAMERLGMTDHGPVHVKIVTNIALRILRLLVAQGVEPALVTNYRMSEEDAEIVVVLAALLHDVGMSIHRKDHEAYSLFVAAEKLKELLPTLYELPVSTLIRSEVLHAIIAHRSGGSPLTLEAGIVRLADALDMAKGRSRIPFESGSVSIHSVSAAAVEGVTIEKGTEKPVCVHIHLVNSAGVFQVDKLLRDKLDGSGLEPHVEVLAKIEGEAERKLVHEFRI